MSVPVSEVPEEPGDLAASGRRLVRTGSPREREIVLTFPRRWVGPGVAAAALAVAFVFTVGFVVGRRGAAPRYDQPLDPPPAAPAAAVAASGEPTAPRDAGPRPDASSKALPAAEPALDPVTDPAAGPAIERAAERAAEPGPRVLDGLATAPRLAAAVDVVVGGPAPKAGWGLQVGAYPSLDEARAYVAAHAASLGERRVHILPAQIAGRGTWHRVRIGYYSSRAEAEAAKKALPSDLASNALVVSYK
jgi:septal ring-binding cell division protein DamX